MTTHVIRLLGPWQFRALHRVDRCAADGSRQVDHDDLPVPGTLKIPADWSEAVGRDFRGQVRFARRFGCPTNLESHERVDLVVEKIAGSGIVFLNEQELGRVAESARNMRFDVTNRLQPRNEIWIDVESTATPHAAAGLTGSIQLEIYSIDAS